MGYRSDVAYAIQFKDRDMLKEFVALHAINEDTRQALNECTLCDDEQPALLFNQTDVKWYPNFEDVQAHEKLLDAVDGGFSEKAAYRFLRLGEDADDNEDKSGGVYDLIPWEAFTFRRCIDIDWKSDSHADLIGAVSNL